MPYPKIYVDSVLLNWGDRLFQDPLRHVRAPRLTRAALGDDAERMRTQIARTLRRAPEVMVKITNSAKRAQGVSAVRRHLRYISRDGRLELEDQNGARIAGAEALRDLLEVWQFGGWGMPQHATHREVFNIVLSMPAGTDRRAVHDAAREFAAQEFGDGRAYVFAAHDDEPHPHVHLCVQARGPHGRRPILHLVDYQRWRERFAAQLRERGVDANATPRRVRGVTQRSPKSAVVYILARGVTPRYWDPLPTSAQRDRARDLPGEVLLAWREMAVAMARSPAREDRAMAVETAHFVACMPVQRERLDSLHAHPARRGQAEPKAARGDDRSSGLVPDVER